VEVRVLEDTSEKLTAKATPNLARSALVFVVLIGVVSLFSDMTYEAARGINGAFLALLGASALVVGVVSGLGELLGYIVRLWIRCEPERAVLALDGHRVRRQSLCGACHGLGRELAGRRAPDHL